MPEVVIAAIVTSVATVLAALVGLIVYIATTWANHVARKDRLRREAVLRVLDATDRLIRAQRRPVVTKLWSTAEVDLFLAQNRVLLHVPKGSNDLWLWLNARVTEIVSRKGRAAAEVGGEIAAAVIEWYRGGLKDEWFRQQNEKEGNSLQVPAASPRARVADSGA